MFHPPTGQTTRLSGIILTALIFSSGGLFAAPVKRALTAGPLQERSISWDLDEDGTVDLTAESFTVITNSIPGSAHTGVTVVARAGVDFVATDASPEASLLSLAPSTVVGGALEQGSWWLGGRTRQISPTIQMDLWLDLTGSRWTGFRLQRGGRTYYGVLQGGPISASQPQHVVAGPVTPPIDFSPQWIPGAPVPLRNFHAVILETEPDTPVVVTDNVTPDVTETNFGIVRPGEFRLQECTVQNATSTPLTGLVWSLEGPDAADFSLPDPLVSELPAGDRLTFHIGFMPVSTGARQATLRIAKGASDPEPYLLHLTGTVSIQPPQFRLEEVGGGEITNGVSVINFGQPEMGTTVTKTFRITNLGNRPFMGAVGVSPRYNSIIWSGSLNGSATWDLTSLSQREGFYLTGASRLTIPPGQSGTFEIAWNPSRVEAVTNIVRIAEGSSYVADFEVSGSGQRPSPVTRHVLFRLGDSQSHEVISGSPVSTEPALVLGDSNVWDGWLDRRSQLNQHMLMPVGGFQFQPRLIAVGNSAPALLPLAEGGGAPASLGSRAALRFTAGAGLRQEDFGLTQHDELGLQLWVRAAGTTGTHALAHVGNPGTSGFGLWQMNGVWRGRLAGNSWVGEAAVQVGAWQHLALVRRGGITTLYLNGQAAGATSTAAIQTSAAYPYTLSSVSDLRIGGAQTEGASCFTGDVDELQFFTLAPSSVFVPATDLASGALPELHFQTTASKTVMQGLQGTIEIEISNAGGGYAVITPESIEGTGASDYALAVTTDTWEQGPPGTPQPLPFTLAPGQRRLLSVTFTPTAAGPRPATLRLSTNDPASPLLEVHLNGSGEAAAPRLRIGGDSAPGQVQFGAVLVGRTAQQRVYLYNAGSQPVTNISLEIAGSQTEQFQMGPLLAWYPSSPAFNGSLAPGTSLIVDITYSPGGIAAHSAVLAVTSNDPAAPRQLTVLSGHGVPPTPDIEVTNSPGLLTPNSTLPFAATMVGALSEEHQIRLTNYGTGPLTIHSVAVTGAHAGDFDLELGSGSGSALDYGESSIWKIAFNPTALGSRTAVLVITSNDPDESPFEVHLEGAGLPALPEIVISNGATILPPNQSFVSVGEARPGGMGNVKTLTISNSGRSPLTDLTLSIDGDHPEAFELGALSTTTVAPGGSATFTVQLQPIDLGPVGAAIRVGSSDPDEGVSIIYVGGTGSYGEQSLLRVERPGWTGTALAETAKGVILLAGYTTDPVTHAQTHEVRRIARDGAEASPGSARPDGIIKSIAASSDGGILITGEFTHVDNAPRQGIARLHANGALDMAFVPPTGDFSGRAVVVLPDGKVWVGGSGSLAGRANLIRLTANGMIDTPVVVTSGMLEAPNGAVNALAVQDDGCLLFGGEFTNLEASSQREITLNWGQPELGRLRRLKVDGSLDPTLGLSGKIYAIVTRGDRIFVAYNTLEQIWRLNLPPLYGHYDTLTCLKTDDTTVSTQFLDSFHPLDSNPGIPRTLALQDDGAVLVAPGPRFWNTTQLQQVSRYRPDGQVDPSFYAVLGEPSQVHALRVQADGKVLVAGQFTGVNKWSLFYLLNFPQSPPLPPTTGQPGFADGGPALGFVQLKPNGDFRPDLRAKNLITGATISDGLTTLDFNSADSEEVSIPVDLVSYFGLDAVYPSPAPSNLVPVLEGPHADDFEVEVIGTSPSEETHWSKLSIAVRFRPSGPGLHEASLSLRLESPTRWGIPHNFLEINLRGFNGPRPNLRVIDASTDLALGGGAVIDFGEIATASSKTRGFILRNGATATGARLENIAVHLVGPQASDFRVATSPTTTLEPGASTTFSIECRPGVSGPTSALVEVHSNDPTQPVQRWTLRASSQLPLGFSELPQSRIASLGTAVTFSASSASPALSWQWLKNGRAIPGATQSTLSLPAVTLAQAGSYAAQLKTAAGKTTSPAAKLAVIGGLPETVPFVTGSPLKFSFLTAGDGLTLQWFKGGEPLLNSPRVSGVLTRSLTISKAVTEDAGLYTCRVGMGNLQHIVTPTNARIMQAPALAMASGGFQWMVGQEVTDQLAVSGDAGHFAVSGLPQGVLVNATTGRLSGKPIRAGNYTLRVRTTNAAGGGETTLFADVQQVLQEGRYLALLDRRSNVFHGRGGKLALTVNRFGSVTGTLTAHATATLLQTYRIAGALSDFTNNGSTSLLRLSIPATAGAPALSLICQIHGHDLSVSLDGEVIGTGGRLRGMVGMVAPFTLAIEPSGAPAALGAIGYARASISARGTLSWAGKLATVSGVRSITLSTDAILGPDSECYPLFATLPNSETFSSWIKADYTAYYLDGESAGWNASAVTDVWDGSDVSLSIRGGLWLAPVPPAKLLNLPDADSNARVLIGEDVSQDIHITPAHRVLPAGGSVWPSAAAGGLLRTVGLNVAAGTFSGATWGRWNGARVGAPLDAPVPFGNIEGVLVSRLGRGVGILRNLDPKDTAHAKALPLILEATQ